MDLPLCGTTAMSHNEFTIRESIEPQEASPMKQEMTVLGIAMAKRVLHAVGMEDTGKSVLRKRLSRHDLMPFAQCITYMDPPRFARIMLSDGHQGYDCTPISGVVLGGALSSAP